MPGKYDRILYIMIPADLIVLVNHVVHAFLDRRISEVARIVVWYGDIHELGTSMIRDVSSDVDISIAHI
jgi:hypothetical protein